MIYRLFRPLLFLLSAEFSHTIALKALKWMHRLGLLSFYKQMKSPVNCMGLHFPNPVGLAAGLDKNGDYIDALASLGFGFIEIGTVTPKPQPGNTKPRLFRLTEHRAIINRMGFNNKGVDYLCKRCEESHYQGILGINIGKNATTPIENAIEDYLMCFRKVYPYASYVVINISSPNTAALRELQFGDYLSNLLAQMKNEQHRLKEQYNKTVPLLVKVAPDLNTIEIQQMADSLLAHHIEGLIVTNTTLLRPDIGGHQYATESGGLSGAPLRDLSTYCLQQFAKHLQGHIPIIGVGGIMSAEDAKAKQNAGANLIQLYTGFVYHGPGLIKRILKMT